MHPPPHQLLHDSCRVRAHDSLAYTRNFSKNDISPNDFKSSNRKFAGNHFRKMFWTDPYFSTYPICSTFNTTIVLHSTRSKGGRMARGYAPPFLHLKGGGHTIWDKKMKKWKEGNKKGKKKEKGERENWHKILFLSPILCVKDYFFFKFKKKNSTFWNKLFTNFYFYPVLWNDRVLIFFVFEKLIVFPSYIRLIILMNHRAAKKNPETSWNLYNKTRHSYIYMYVAYSRRLGWDLLWTLMCVTG